MSKQRSLTPRISFTTLKDLPIAGKLLLLVVPPLGITLVATLILIITGLNRLEAETGTAQLQEEVRIISQQFTQLEANLKMIAEGLAANPILLAAIQQGDKATLQAILLSIGIRSDLSHLQIVDLDGQTLNVTQNFVLDDTPAELERLHKLGLLEIETTELVPTAAGWLLTVVRPLKMETGLVGALSVGRLLDTSTLSKLNFERTSPWLVLLDAQGNIKVSSETNDQGNLKDAFEVNVNLWNQAKQGQMLLDQANIGGEVGRVAYVPLVVGNKTATVFGVLLSTEATTRLRDQLVTTTLIVVGVLTVLGTLSALELGRNLIIRPITALTASAERIRAGQFDVVVPGATNRDEIGQLAATFNNMTAQLRQTLNSLENRTRSLEMISNLGERLVAILNLEELLTELVNQVNDTFGYYHTHIYLLDDKGEKLVVAEGTGTAGAEMKAKGHSIPINAPVSLVARAGRIGEIVKVDNVRETEDWLPNPLLPDTYAEMAVPILLEGRVVGVLDVQNNERAGLDEGDASLLRSLASQVAVAMRNARLFAEVETALIQARSAQEKYAEQAWQQRKGQIQKLEHLHIGSVAAPALAETTLTQAKQLAQAQDRPALVTLAGPETNSTSIVAPVTLSGKTIGVLQAHRLDSMGGAGAETPPWTDEDLAVVETVLDQVAQAAENLRLFEETRERAGRERTVREITDKLRQAPTLNLLAKMAAEELGRVLGVSHSLVKLGIIPEEKQFPDSIISPQPQNGTS